MQKYAYLNFRFDIMASSSSYYDINFVPRYLDRIWFNQQFCLISFITTKKKLMSSRRLKKKIFFHSVKLS